MKNKSKKGMVVTKIRKAKNKKTVKIRTNTDVDVEYYEQLLADL